jgi:hypothetical protein
MTVYCPALESSFGLGARAIAGSSDAAKLVERLIEEGILHYAEPRICLLVSDIDQLLNDSNQEVRSEDTIPIDMDTARAAIEFAYTLPRSLPAPEVAPEPDGEISFDWLGPTGKMFSVSVGKTGRVAYAGRFGERSNIHGTEQISETCPQEIIRGISRTIR